MTMTPDQLNALNPKLYSAIKNVISTYPPQSLIDDAIQTVRVNNVIHGEDLGTITQESDGDKLGCDLLSKLKPDWYQRLKSIPTREEAMKTALDKLENVPNLNNLSAEENSVALSALGVRTDLLVQYDGQESVSSFHDAFGAWQSRTTAAFLGDDYVIDVAGAAASIEG